jgi:hypothetical protein
VLAEGKAAVCGRWPAAIVVVVVVVLVVVGGRVVVVLAVLVVVLVGGLVVVVGRDPAELGRPEPQDATTSEAQRTSARDAVRRTARR